MYSRAQSGAGMASPGGPQESQWEGSANAALENLHYDSPAFQKTLLCAFVVSGSCRETGRVSARWSWRREKAGWWDMNVPLTPSRAKGARGEFCLSKT